MKSDSDGMSDGDLPDGEDDVTREDRPSKRDRARGASDASMRDGESRSEREPAAVGARAAAGSARAAARASAASTVGTPAKGRPTPQRDRGEHRGNIFVRINRYLREVVSELRKVIWPTKNEMVTYSIVVILFLIFMIALTWAADFGFARAVLAVFG